MPDVKELKNRIEGITEMRKITNAMYLIASVKLRQAKEELERTRPFFDVVRHEMPRVFRADEAEKSAYFFPAYGGKRDDETTVGFLVITADKGLAGAYSRDVIKEALARARACTEADSTKLFVVGEYGRQYLRNRSIPFAEEFDFPARNPSYHRAREISVELLKRYDSGEIDELRVLYTDYENGMTTKIKEACILPFVPARDHKRLMDGAKGPNTGGMGAVTPLSDVTDEQLKLFDENIVQPTLKGLIAEKWDYRGFIFFGVMLCKDGPKLLEYNVRLGDPETQALLPLMDCDFAEMCTAIADVQQTGTLKAFAPKFKWKKGFVCSPVAVSGGYPAAYEKGKEIHLPETKDVAVKIFIAGADYSKEDKQKLVTTGGRVLAASAFGDSFEKAYDLAYKTMEKISFDKMFYRKDIGLPGAAESGEL